MNTQGTTRVTSIGHIAHKALLRRPTGFVTGTTSQGIFLQLDGDFTLFLTYEPFRGPLTINIRGDYGKFASIQAEDTAELLEDRLTFRKSGQAIDIFSPLIWKPGFPPTIKKSLPDRGTSLFQQVRELDPQYPHLPLLNTLINGAPLQWEESPDVGSWIIKLSNSLKGGNPAEMVSDMCQILGAGPGLTPLGDDLLLGILLTIARIRKPNSWLDDEIYLFQAVLNAAREKTTRVSWSLLSCAIQGSADERIIRVLDGLIAAREIPDRDLESLINWGSSSGMAVLGGMLLALS